MSEAIWAFFGVVVGGALTLGAEWIRGRKEEERLRLNAELAGEKARDDFQRTNLLELQEAFAVWVRAEGAAMHFDQMTLRQAGHLTMLPEQLSDDVTMTGRKLKYLLNRVLDGETRQFLHAAFDLSVELHVARIVRKAEQTEAQLESESMKFSVLVKAAEDRIGETLRAYLKSF